MIRKVVLGMSGGVDSAVAAVCLREQGYDVYGLFLELGLGGEETAQQTAREINIPLYIAHQKDLFKKLVCQPFAEAYRNGSTPNPCVCCNPLIKFHTLAEYARQIDAPYIATGHYVRTGRDAQGRALLLRAHTAKDQSYMLYRLSRETVAKCLFPLGEVENKEIVREQARTFGISAAEQPDSMDVCFIPDGDTGGWLERHGVGCPSGNFVDEQGNILGRHKGIHHYTVGQRKGLGVAAAGRLFVQELRPETNEVVLSLQDIYKKEISVQETHYIAPEYVEPSGFHCSVRIRFSKFSYGATVYPEEEKRAHIVFDDVARAPAKGQSAVFYHEDIVIGGGFIV